MEAVITVLLALLVALLFYKLVERRHKVALFKILGVLALLTALIVAGLYLIGEYLPERGRERKLASVTIEFLPTRLERLRALVRKHGDKSLAFPFADSLDFKVCNGDPSHRLLYVRFTPKTYKSGRSTAIDVTTDTRRLSSDQILAPVTCDTLRWSGTYVVLDSVVVEAPDSVVFDGD